jgi:type II secretory pathway pseudopilin PulG
MAEQTTNPATTSDKASKMINRPRKRRGKGLINFILILGIIAAVALFAWAEQQRRDAISRLQETEEQLERIRKSTQESGQAVADEVLGKLRNHYDIPADIEPTVATIIDVDKLREASPFYDKAQNGDHLIITENRAILYNAERDLILDVVPVQLDNTNTQQATVAPETGEENPAASPADETSPETAP